MKLILNIVKKCLSLLVGDFLSYRLFLYKWNKKNTHNSMRPTRAFPLDSVIVGKATYGDLTVFSLGKSNFLKIGNYCSIAEEVTFLLNIDHNYNRISTFPFRKINNRVGTDVVNNGDIIVEDDVWIGYRSTIMSGVHIGQGAIIGAGSIVTHNIPPYSIACGVPAKVIKKRFSDNIIKDLLSFDLSSINETSELLDCEISQENYKKIMKSLKI